MADEKHIQDDYKVEERVLLRSCVKKSISIVCYENLLNQNQFDFLKKSVDNNYVLPYQISDSALIDKIRQYEPNIYITDTFKKQISGRTLESTGKINIPYGYYMILRNSYEKRYPNLLEFINTETELNKIVEINDTIKFSKIVKIFNKKIS
jgi:hypothetical protein